MNKAKNTTEDDIDALAEAWINVNQTIPAKVKHGMYPVGFVAALIEKLETFGHNVVQPTARTFRYNDASVIDELEQKRQAELRKKVDHWRCWKSDWKRAIEAGYAPGDPIKPEMPHMPMPDEPSI